ncbi:hypothetical protein BDW42DRAFT_168486 [Aspergillus taichungensis]|uniref:Uncharacterized protein n=1 Tax=Aspergillus taichungensis TaxID=482145 RepID=A0A2J5HWB6_9EURO|nr:hypothetical protein BDW42DRAFT_168486 [Aspergillus taichungensis]
MENDSEPMKLFSSGAGPAAFFLVPTSSVPKPMCPRLGCCLRGSQVDLLCVCSLRFLSLYFLFYLNSLLGFFCLDSILSSLRSCFRVRAVVIPEGFPTSMRTQGKQG